MLKNNKVFYLHIFSSRNVLVLQGHCVLIATFNTETLGYILIFYFMKREA